MVLSLLTLTETQLSNSIMRSDAKLGLALGMLVVGFAVAFCFPREGRLSIFQQAEQRHEQENQIEDIQFVPIRDLREEPGHEEFLPAVTSIASNHQAENLESDFAPEDSPQTSQVSSNSGLNDILPRNNAELLPEYQTLLPSENISQEKLNNVYRVQQGDTLSGISLKTLGSYSRYLDIYNANRDILESPDDLRLGLELKIPLPKSNEPAPSLNQLTEQKQVLDLENESESAKRFSSPGRTPFLSDSRQTVPVHQIQLGKVKTHVVQPGDSLQKISVRYFGTLKAAQQLRKLNPDLPEDLKKLRPGTVLRLAE